MKFRLAMNIIGTSALFGYWQSNWNAAAFMALLLGFILSAIEYAKEGA